ncbi:MAG: type II toxin-antitoxin system RelE/ParE family toxin [Bacteroidetes bacterium]|jgi:mRNA interferase RelE/StbE|nr:type II toxin-antitoxin system RelE/ParE family toxin [Bacteroidota bacterium]MBT5528874.1 type II toxin-antitoxin system RelE/ParE family toxin [Cytophagia bacterium]MBT3801548.1 type II toxin-antitoxin system RelE/ParE family toxin [Bacteroidota bacterium]MBT3933988.1 type II toxin-antitoxin system RelE/ParE family toxin [Bacteroidota bacterium]MBT4339491.1 type II toxin-antitoxin system RelE/ParE family toxin [Bacteroidota bacterium]
MEYSIFIKVKAKKELLKLNQKDRNRIIVLIDSLKNNPRPTSCLKLQGDNSVYRLRSGVFRILYLIEDDKLIIEVIKIGHRKQIYRKK